MSKLTSQGKEIKAYQNHGIKLMTFKTNRLMDEAGESLDAANQL